jgi:hypothetical protein
MTKIEMLADNLLLKKVEAKKSEFEVTGAVEANSPLYEVAFSGPEAPAKPGDTVIVKPGSYDNQVIDGVTYLFAEGFQVAGKVANGK